MREATSLSATTSAPNGGVNEAPHSVPCVPIADAQQGFAPTRASDGRDGSVVLSFDALGSLGPSISGSIHYRRLTPRDMGECESLHRALFPISYEEVFYLTALSESDGIITLCAVERDFGGDERIVGVVTARVVPQTDEEDREVVAAFIRRKRGRLRAMTRWLTEALAKTQPKGGGEVLETPYVYILTLGVLTSHRRKGLASELLDRIVERAVFDHQVEVSYLHVITHDAGALRFYTRGNGYEVLTQHVNFYRLPPEGCPEPGRIHYDAFTLARGVGKLSEDSVGRTGHGRGGPSPLGELARGWEQMWRAVVALITWLRMWASQRLQRKEQHYM